MTTESEVLAQVEALQEAFDDGVVLYHLTRGTLHRLAGSAASIWQAFDMPTTLDAAIDRLASDFDQQRDDIAEDVRRTVCKLREEDLLVVTLSQPLTQDAAGYVGGA